MLLNKEDSIYYPIYPQISPASEFLERVVLSVMIPTYNRSKYLTETLQSILEQDIGNDLIQIEVIDNCSENVEIEEIVKNIGQGKIAYYRQPIHVDGYQNWNTCIQRARGYWVHILHDDDCVLPGFYKAFKAAITQSPKIGALFCRAAYINSDGQFLHLSPFERKTRGVCLDILETLAIKSCIAPPSIIVRREAYELLGGFSGTVGSAMDWEMWKRVAAHFPIWYEPQVLAKYRIHSSSWTSELVKTGKNISHARKSIASFKRHLPPEKAEKLSQKAQECYAQYAIDTAWRLVLEQQDWQAAIAQIKESFKCSCSFPVVWQALIFFIWLILYLCWTDLGFRRLFKWQSNK